MARPFKSKDVAAIKVWHTERLRKLEVLSSDDVAGVDAVKSFA